MKRLKPYDKVDNFITKCYDNEVDKWNAGLSNNMDEWERFLDDWKVIDDIAYFKKNNAELRVYNERLLNDNSKLSYSKQKIKEDYDRLLKKLKLWYELLKIDGGNTKHQVVVDIESILKGGE